MKRRTFLFIKLILISATCTVGQIGDLQIDDHIIIGDISNNNPNANLHVYDTNPSVVLDGLTTNIRFERNGVRKAYFGMNLSDLFIQNSYDADIVFQNDGVESARLGKWGLKVDGLLEGSGLSLLNIQNQLNGITIENEAELVFHSEDVEAARLSKDRFSVSNWFQGKGLSFIKDLNNPHPSDDFSSLSFGTIDLAGWYRTDFSIEKYRVFSNSSLNISTWGDLSLQVPNVGIGLAVGEATSTLDVDGDVRIREIPSQSGSSDLRYNSSGVLCKSSSDIRFKESIEPIEDGLDKLISLQGVSYIWKNDPSVGRQLGLIAQDVKEVIPEIVNEDKAGYLSIDYSEMAGLFVEAIKEQQLVIEEQSKVIDELISNYAILKSKLDQNDDVTNQ